MLLLSFCFLQEKLDAIDDERQAHAGIFAQRASEQGALCGAPAGQFSSQPAPLLAATVGRRRHLAGSTDRLCVPATHL